jgi:hypothetical protein
LTGAAAGLDGKRPMQNKTVQMIKKLLVRKRNNRLANGVNRMESIKVSWIIKSSDPIKARVKASNEKIGELPSFSHLCSNKTAFLIDKNC